MTKDSSKDLYKSHRTHRHTWASPDTGSGKTSGIEVIIFFCLWAVRFIMQVPFLLSADQLLCSLNHKERNLGSAPHPQINCLSPWAPSNCWESGLLSLPAATPYLARKARVCGACPPTRWLRQGRWGETTGWAARPTDMAMEGELSPSQHLWYKGNCVQRKMHSENRKKEPVKQANMPFVTFLWCGKDSDQVGIVFFLLVKVHH